MKKVFSILSVLITFAIISSCSDDEDKALSSLNSITEFKISFSGVDDKDVISKLGDNITISVPFKTSLKGLKPTIKVSDKATVSPKSGVAIDFVDGVAKPFIVTAEDGSKKTYKVTITVRGEVGSGSRIKTFLVKDPWGGADALTTYKYASSNFVNEYETKIGKKTTAYKYVYNKKNQITEKKGDATKENTVYKYNEKGQIINASYTKDGKLKYSYTYTYDEKGQLTEELRVDEQEEKESRKKAIKKFEYKDGNVVKENRYGSDYIATYDTKNNPFIGIYPKAYATINVGAYGDEKVNKNNLITITGADAKITYTYNKEDYPLTLSYTIFGGAATIKREFTYYTK